MRVREALKAKLGRRKWRQLNRVEVWEKGGRVMVVSLMSGEVIVDTRGSESGLESHRTEHGQLWATIADRRLAEELG